ncbi:MAG: cytochrome C [Nitrospinae bacterium CG11_big_fil_rev_8_21_14_0_20_56_8]|nr:MAG: cytochrome C [Nitrospinae bacterium CG11_big_fil_rev_8_21_14_0_20_56_8]
MLPEQKDILWTFLSMAFTVFALYAFINVVRHAREREGVNGKFWGTVFAGFLVISFLETVHMFDLVQGEQLLFFFKYIVLTVFLLLLSWGIFFKSEKIEDQSPPIIRGFFFWMAVSVSLAGYTNWLPQQRSDPPPKETAIAGDLTMEEYAEMGRVIVFGAKQVAGQKSIGKGQCPLCHTFDPGDNIGRCPNLFGVEERSHTRVKEERYATSPVKIGDAEPATGVVKGKPDQIPAAYKRAGSPDLIGEDYLRESLMCPTCYVVEGYGKEGDTKSPMPVISKPPISLSPVELNAVIAWLQSKDNPGDYSKVTVPLPTAGSGQAKEEKPAEDEGEKPVFVTGNEPIDEMINTLGCPLCHTIPGVEGAVGALGPVLHEKINAPKRIKDPNYKGKATNTKEYVKESILTPSAFVVFNEEAGESFPDGLMPQDFKNKLSIDALDKLVDFISQTQPQG